MQADPRLHSRGTLELLDYLRDVVWNDSRSSDIVVECFGVEYNLHKLVLSRCPYFRSMFSSVWEESRNRKVVLEIDDPDIDAISVQQALQFLYGFTLEYKDVASVLSLYACAGFLAMDSLREQCRAFLLDRLDFPCVDRYYRFFRRKCYADGDVVLKACRTLLVSRAKDRPEVLTRLPHELLCEVLASDALCVRAEHDRFLLIQWLLDALEAVARGEAAAAGDEAGKPLPAPLPAPPHPPVEAARPPPAVDTAGGMRDAGGPSDPSSSGPSAPPASPVASSPSPPPPDTYGAPDAADAACDTATPPGSVAGVPIGGEASPAQRLREALHREVRFSAFTYRQLFEARQHGPVDDALLQRGLWRKEYARTVLTRAADPVPHERFEELRWWAEFPKSKISLHSTFSDVTFAFGSLWKLSVRVDVKDGKSALACFLYRESIPSGPAAQHVAGYEYSSMHRKFRYSFCLPDVDCDKKYSGTQEFLREKGDNWGFPRMYEYGALEEIVRGASLNIAVCLLPVL